MKLHMIVMVSGELVLENCRTFHPMKSVGKIVVLNQRVLVVHSLDYASQKLVHRIGSKKTNGV